MGKSGGFGDSAALVTGMNQLNPVVSLSVVLTMQEVSEHLRIPINTLRDWRKDGKGPRSFKLGGHVRYRAEDVQDWMNQMLEAS